MIPILVKQSADPAAGSEVVFTADEDLIVQCASVTLVASGVAGTRLPVFVADDGDPTHVFYRTKDGTGVGPSGTQLYSLFRGCGSPGSAVGRCLPGCGLYLRKGDRLRTITAALDAGDNYSAMVLQVERR